MLIDEFAIIAADAVGTHPGHIDIAVTGVRPSPHGPLVDWIGGSTMDRQDDGRTIQPPAAQDLLRVLARALALRWQEGRAVVPADWDARLRERYPGTFDDGGPYSGGGWRWLWEAGASLIQDTGVKRFSTSQTKEKFAQIRWYYSIEGRCRNLIREDVGTIVDCVEHLSAFVCETCGAPGQIRKGGWAKTCCDAHAPVRKR